MYGINFNENWTFKELVENIEAIKSQIWDVIASFSCFQQHEETLFKRQLKRTIYSYNFSEKKRNKIIEYIYDDIEFDELLELANGGKKDGKGTKK